MDEVLHNSALLLVVITLLYIVIAGTKMTERMRVILVYIFSIALALSGSLPLLYVTIGSFVVLLLSLEFLSDDEWRLKIFTRPDHKLLDFFYRMFVEYAYLFYLFAIVATFIAQHMDTLPYQILYYGVALFCAGASLIFLTSQKYMTKPIGKIVERFQTDILTYHEQITPHVETFFGILVAMEDRGFYDRKPRQHTIPLSRVITKGFSYFKKNRNTSVFRTVKNAFSRGYGTIEMQLLRTIGMDFGYQYTIRRKLFEIIYANILLNGYYDYLWRARGNHYRYRDFILLKYIESVNVSINGRLFTSTDRPSLLKVFDASSYEQITKEEFFVWCLGLPHRDYIDPDTVNLFPATVRDYGLDAKKIKRILRNFPIADEDATPPTNA